MKEKRFSLELCMSNGGRTAPRVVEEWPNPLTAAEVDEIKDRAPLLGGFFYRVRELGDE